MIYTFLNDLPNTTNVHLKKKPWPVVEDFLNGLKPGSLGADVGCGNGKYIGVNPNVLVLGSDRSSNLIKIVHDRGFEGMVADGLNLPYRDNSFVCVFFSLYTYTYINTFLFWLGFRYFYRCNSSFC